MIRKTKLFFLVLLLSFTAAYKIHLSVIALQTLYKGLELLQQTRTIYK